MGRGYLPHILYLCYKWPWLTEGLLSSFLLDGRSSTSAKMIIAQSCLVSTSSSIGQASTSNWNYIKCSHEKWKHHLPPYTMMQLILMALLEPLLSLLHLEHPKWAASHKVHQRQHDWGRSCCSRQQQHFHWPEDNSGCDEQSDQTQLVLHNCCLLLVALYNSNKNKKVR